MNNFKGTPGPWDHAAIAYGGQISVVLAKEWNVAVCCDNLPGGRNEQTANAALIAQAPSMLQAIADMDAWFQRERAGFTGDRKAEGGEAQWRAWFDGNLDLCDRVERQCRAILAALREGGAL